MAAHPEVALTVDTDTFPPHFLVRGKVSLETVDGVPSECLEASRMQAGEAGMPTFEAQVQRMYRQMNRYRAANNASTIQGRSRGIPSGSRGALPTSESN